MEMKANRAYKALPRTNKKSATVAQTQERTKTNLLEGIFNFGCPERKILVPENVSPVWLACCLFYQRCMLPLHSSVNNNTSNTGIKSALADSVKENYMKILKRWDQII